MKIQYTKIIFFTENIYIGRGIRIVMPMPYGNLNVNDATQSKVAK